MEIQKLGMNWAAVLLLQDYFPSLTKGGESPNVTVGMGQESHRTVGVPQLGCGMPSTARGMSTQWEDRFHRAFPELKAAFNLHLQHNKSKPDTECRSKAVVLFFLATAAGTGSTSPLASAPILHSSASAQLWEHEWSQHCCRSNAHDSGEQTPHKYTESLLLLQYEHVFFYVVCLLVSCASP